MHIAVTGASGYIGQALVRLLLADKHEVTAVVRDGLQVPVGCRLLIHDFDSGKVPILPQGVDAVAHLAQSRAYRAFPADAEVMFSVNVAGTHQMLVAAAQAQVSRFILVSSGTVYEPFTGLLEEDASLNPSSNLGATKLAAEVLSRPFGKLFPIAIMRLFMPYGPRQQGRLIPDIVRRVREGQAVTLPEEGGGMRFAPIYIDDLCALISVAIKESWSGVYNIASRESLNIEDAAICVGLALGRIPVFERKPGGSPVVVPELARLAAHYDLSQFRSFANGIAAMLAVED